MVFGALKIGLFFQTEGRIDRNFDVLASNINIVKMGGRMMTKRIDHSFHAQIALIHIGMTNLPTTI